MANSTRVYILLIRRTQQDGNSVDNGHKSNFFSKEHQDRQQRVIIQTHSSHSGAYTFEMFHAMYHSLHANGEEKPTKHT